MTELVIYESKAEPKQPDLSELHPLDRGRDGARKVQKER